MTTKIHSQAHWRVVASTAPRILLIISVALLMLLIGTRTANRVVFAGSTVGSFEIDGNLIVDHSVPPAEPIDWDSTLFPAAITTLTDGTGPADAAYRQGRKQKDQSTSSCTDATAPAT